MAQDLIFYPPIAGECQVFETIVKQIQISRVEGKYTMSSVFSKTPLESGLDDIRLSFIKGRFTAVFNPCPDIVDHEPGFFAEIPI